VQRTLVVAQFAFALALLAAGSWMTRSFLALNQAKLGFEPDRLLTLRFYLPGDAWDEVGARARFHRQLVERVSALPGVVAAATTAAIPVDDGGAEARVATETSSLAPEETLAVSVVWTQPELFATLGVPLAAGVPFATAEGERADAPSALVNRALAEALWPGEDPLGRRLRYGVRPDAPLVTVVGVAPELVYEELTEQTPRARLQLFVPYARLGGWRTSALIVRADGDPAALARPVRAALAALEPDAPVFDVLTMPARLARTFEDRRLLAELVAIFAAQGLLLAAVGVFGVLAYAVAQRRRELGIRAALGAAPGKLAREIARDGLRLALLGAGLGLLLALAGGRLLRGVVYGVDPLDPVPLVATTLVLAAVALLACLGPARRAARLDPARVLREE
jgi:predicted permease